MTAHRMRIVGIMAAVVVAAAGATSVPVFAAPGDLDETFGTAGKVTTDFNGLTDIAEGIAIQPDNKIVVAGCDDWLGCRPSQAGSGRDFEIARYNLNGTLDTGFDGDGKVVTDFEGGADGAADVAIRQDGKIVAAGTATTCVVGCGRGIAVARYEAGGAPDPTFGVAGEVVTHPTAAGVTYLEGHAVAVHEGKTIVAGAACNNSPFTAGCDYDFVVARYLDNGLLDASFGGDGVVTTAFGVREDLADAVVVQPDGKILVGGLSSAGQTCTTVCTSDWNFALARFNSDGTPDLFFGTAGKVTTDFGEAEALRDLAIRGDKLVAAGRRDVWRCFPGFCKSVGDVALARYNLVNGSLDTSFGGVGAGKVTTDLGGDDSASGVALDSLGRIVVAGSTCSTSTSDCVSDFAIVRYGADGALDKGFASAGKVTTDFGGNDRASDVAIQGDDKIVAAGTDGSNFALARYLNEDTPTTDTTPPGAPTLLSPANGATTNDNTPSFDWSDVTDPSGVSYQLQADNSSTFRSPELDQSGLSASSFTPSTALADGTYSWRARAADGAGNVGAWSSVFTLTVDTTPRGGIAGVVTDAKTKAGIAAATVNCGSGVSASTATDGRYSIGDVPAGTYTCTASHPDYRAKSQNVTVNSGQTTTANFALRTI